jgi:biofilm PGA synthesis protein PgaD
MKKLIIDQPSLAPLPDRIGWAFVKALFWIIWICLWMPLITVLLWMLGVHLYNEHFMNSFSDHSPEHRHLFLLYCLVVLALGSCLLLWARTEFLRFRQLRRRQRPSAVQSEELADFASLSEQQIRALRSAQRMIAHHDAQGKLLYSEIVDAAAPGQADRGE